MYIWLGSLLKRGIPPPAINLFMGYYLGGSDMKNEYEIRGEVTAIFLKRKDGTVIETIIDTSDLEKVNSFPMTWYAAWEPHTKSYYCYGNEKAIERRQKKIKLHRFLFDLPTYHLVIDHINHDTLDNRRTNLRVVDNFINAQNRKAIISTNKSGTKGVSWDDNHKKWIVSFVVKRKKFFLGRFRDLEAAKEVAVKAYQEIISGCYNENPRKSPGKAPSSGISGISWSKEKSKWRLYFRLGNKPKHYGYFESLDDAIQEKNKLLSQKSS